MNERERLGLPDPNTPLLQAARWNDAMAEEHGIEEVCERLGVSLDEVHYVAEQRALRARLIQTGRIAEVSSNSGTWNLDGSTRMVSNKPFTPVLSNDDRAAITTLTAVYIDAIVVGWHAYEIAHRG